MSELDVREALESFLRHCDALDDILRHAAGKDLRRIRLPFLMPRLVRLPLGDVLRFLVAHGERHLLQAQRDYFGAHRYQRVDRPGYFHTAWTPETEG